MYDEPWVDSEELDDRLGEGLLGRIKSELTPWSICSGPTGPRFLLRCGSPSCPPCSFPWWPDSAASPWPPCSDSSARPGWTNATLILALGLAPLVLGGMIVAHLISLAIRRLLKRRRLARLVYAVTDHRAIVGRVEARSGEMQAFSLRPGDVVDTRRFENPDGSGDLFFLGQGNDQWLPLGLPRGSLALAWSRCLVRETLIDTEAGLVEVRSRRGVLSPTATVELTGFIHVHARGVLHERQPYSQLSQTAQRRLARRGRQGRRGGRALASTSTRCST